MIRWTPEKIAELRSLAHMGEARIAKEMGMSPGAVQQKASELKISLKRAPVIVAADHAATTGIKANHALRARWAELIGPMKERLRHDVEKEMRT